ncbi:hypothetical protein B0A49_01830 [Cryomyces minteri]|uniref:Thiaminase-2/PQQC domain-containing protein n=1 Tax=Cryomyces minteri TaxID=331657 RepID=A0A4U0XRE1_9PEZI|nr:hypothetical protein B0A49_01830 [Cryomyces minteri]
MGRTANPDIRRAFEEFQDETTPSKCNKVRCLHCGFVRAKNTTRQIEHLNACEAYLTSDEGIQALHATQQGDQPQENGDSNGTTANPSAANTNGAPSSSASAMFNGTRPNPNLQVHRRGPNQNKRARDGAPIQPMPPPPMMPPAMPHVMPSLTGHLLGKHAAAFTAATQQPFLSHAGCATLAAAPLSQWLIQDAHYARGYIGFIGQLLGKIRLPAVKNSAFHPMYRTMDLLISAMNNIRREMSFFEITAGKYALHMSDELPNPITRSYLDLFVSASGSAASLLEGMVVLWATEHCYCTAWHYAASFSNTLSNPSSLTSEPHIAALHQALIPNWTSSAFVKFVESCRSIVDELANASTGGNGKEDLARCESVFAQICWLEERFWPDVDGMGEEDETGRHVGGGHGGGLRGTPVAQSASRASVGSATQRTHESPYAAHASGSGGGSGITASPNALAGVEAAGVEAAAAAATAE